MVKVTDSYLTCHEFHTSTTEDPPCKGAMNKRHPPHLTIVQNYEVRRQILRASLPYTAGLLWHWARTRDMPTMIRYLDHLIPRPQVRRQNFSSS
ncbi:hypothetical protein TNCV_1209001 [Trichonephila clavipes]|nr:hypothetical protein TNCV_1209001 [Trichonephila clavipes]